MSLSTEPGILLFAHGSRDPLWRQPFETILARVTASHRGPVTLAFLEHMQPDFMASCDEMVKQGIVNIRVVPLFLAAGGHVRQCIPDLTVLAKAKHPGVTFEVAPPLGDDPSVIDALVQFSLGTGANSRAPRATEPRPETHHV